MEDAPYSLRALLSEQLRDTLVKAGYDPAPESLRIDSVTTVTVDTPMFKTPSRLYTMLHITFAYSARTRSQVAAQPTPSWTDNDQEVSLFTAAPMADSSLSGMTNGDTVTPSPTQTATPTPAPSYGPFVAADKPITLDIPIFPTVEKLLSLGINSDDNEMISVEEAADSFVISSRRYGHENATYTELLLAALRLNVLVERMQSSSHKEQNKLATALYDLIHRYGQH